MADQIIKYLSIYCNPNSTPSSATRRRPPPSLRAARLCWSGPFGASC